ncbi:MAG: hypothetical protein ABI846_09775 [Rudaea sp.]
MNIARLLVSNSLLVAMSITAPARAADACNAVFDAMAKLATTPHHQYMSEPAGDKPGHKRESEIVQTATMHYLKVQGTWVARAYDEKAAAALASRAANDGELTCKMVDNENVDGQPTNVFATHHETDGGSADQRIWISTSTGLPLRQTIDIEVGDDRGKTHKDLRYEYMNVSAPSG